MSPIRNDHSGISPRFFSMFTPHPEGWGKYAIISVISEFYYPSFMAGD